ncbi:hypothetical protein [Dokdonella sp.]|uniref:hypothetical protein n=1 Tax=Dokdonella sp. TaxID=2291710 RepID=UPI002F3F8690
MKATGSMQLAFALASCAPMTAHCADLGCHLSFTTTAWSALYSSAQGEGIVFCDDGSAMRVDIVEGGLGLAAGRWAITDGRGAFSGVQGIDEVVGEYVAVSANVGLIKAATVHVLAKGGISLALAGQGAGFDIGLCIGRFEVRKSAQGRR